MPPIRRSKKQIIDFLGCDKLMATGVILSFSSIIYIKFYFSFNAIYKKKTVNSFSQQ